MVAEGTRERFLGQPLELTKTRLDRMELVAHAQLIKSLEEDEEMMGKPF
jgi:hypothetical protein